ncbi:polysaccharide deacetylase family protein [Magnetospirillum sulfuroxidans]|uniref:polysaccharide deacetylase family protein n=1 Tax=Magnetospirillum sulfuroxidans TaxID=611300 RepID=UPI002013484E|nr:polysaccharide deacetylase family protein [Magnetospirillum sulfuroxidans]
MGISWSLGAWRPVLRHVADARAVAITIDDAPTPETMPAMLDLLDHYRGKATFFMSGCRAVEHDALVADTVHRGHAIYAHGWEHIRLDRAGPDRLIADMEKCEALLTRHRPTPNPYLVRLPYNGGYRNATVHRALQRWQPGCQIAHWGPSTEDHLISTRCQSDADIAPQCAAEVDRILADPRLPGAIILMHDQPINERPGSQFKAAVTVELLRQLLDRLSGAGYACVTIPPAPTAPWWSRYALV